METQQIVKKWYMTNCDLRDVEKMVSHLMNHVPFNEFVEQCCML